MLLYIYSNSGKGWRIKKCATLHSNSGKGWGIKKCATLHSNSGKASLMDTVDFMFGASFMCQQRGSKAKANNTPGQLFFKELPWVGFENTTLCCLGECSINRATVPGQLKSYRGHQNNISVCIHEYTYSGAMYNPLGSDVTIASSCHLAIPVISEKQVLIVITEHVYIVTPMANIFSYSSLLE